MPMKSAVASCLVFATIAVLSPTGTAAAATPPVTVARYANGAIFITAQGRSLYVRDDDTAGNGCDAKCLATWRPLSASRSDTGPLGWGVMRRTDGTFQWAYKDRPLYLCRKDVAPGEVKCDGADKGRWHVARP